MPFFIVFVFLVPMLLEILKRKSHDEGVWSSAKGGSACQTLQVMTGDREKQP
jgi:hypothetical protein